MVIMNNVHKIIVTQFDVQKGACYNLCTKDKIKQAVYV